MQAFVAQKLIKTFHYTYFLGLFIHSSLLCFFASLICTIMIKKSLSITFPASQQMEINKFSGRIFSNPKIPINHWVIKEPQHRCSKSVNRSQKSKRGSSCWCLWKQSVWVQKAWKETQKAGKRDSLKALNLATQASASADEQWSEAANGASNECKVSGARHLLQDLHREVWKTGREEETEIQIERLKTRVLSSCLALRSLCDSTFVQDLFLICFLKKKRKWTKIITSFGSQEIWTHWMIF